MGFIWVIENICKQGEMIKTSWTRYWYVGEELLTWVWGGDESSLGEIAVEVVATMWLIVSIHNISGMGCNCIGKEARPTCLNGTAIYAIAACIINVCLQGLWACICFCNTPLLPFTTRWCRCWDRRCCAWTICLQFNSTKKYHLQLSHKRPDWKDFEKQWEQEW